MPTSSPDAMAESGADDHGRGLWQVLDAHATPNPRHDKRRAGLAATAKDEKGRPFVVGEIILGEWSIDGNQWPVGLLLVEGLHADYHDLRGLATPASEAIARAMDSLPRGALVFIRNGSRMGFHVFLRYLGRPLAAAGWQIYPLAAGSEIRGLNLKRGGQSVYLADLEACAGWSESAIDRAIADRGGPQRPEQGSLERLYFAIDKLQRTLLATFGVGLKPSIGALAVKALQRTLPAGFVWWKPHPLLAAACGWGGAMRGGYSRSERFSGPAWKVDMTRAYTWALGSPLPARSALCRCEQGKEEGPGLYLYRIDGASEVPAYLPSWNADRGQFRKGYFTAYHGVAFLPQEEAIALRAMGYVVRGLWGWRTTQTLTLHGFTSRLAGLQATYGRGSPEATTAKLLGNALYGKLAQSALREDVCYSVERPADGWWPFITPEQEIVPYLWAKPSTLAEPYHHIDAAALVTARVRGRCTAWIADYVRRGGRVPYWDTDGGLVAPEPPSELLSVSDVPGAMRAAGYDGAAMVLGAKRYVWAGEAHAAGVSGVSAADVEVLRTTGRVVVARHLLGRPWLGSGAPAAAIYTLS